jgi:hypothetical protein
MTMKYIFRKLYQYNSYTKLSIIVFSPVIVYIWYNYTNIFTKYIKHLHTLRIGIIILFNHLYGEIWFILKVILRWYKYNFLQYGSVKHV